MVSDEEFTKVCETIVKMGEQLRSVEKRLLFHSARADALEAYVITRVDAEPYKNRQEAQDALNHVKRLVYDDHLKALEEKRPDLAAKWDFREDLEGTEEYDKWILPQEED